LGRALSTDKQGKSGLGLEAQRQAVANYLDGGDWKIMPSLLRSRPARGQIARNWMRF
jgi:hypothetical protein